MIKFMSLLLETIRLENGHLQNLPWHQQRLNRSQQALFADFEPIALEEAIAVPEQFRPNGIFKCRLTYGQRIEKIEFEPYTFRTIRSLQLVDAGHIEYRHKYADRSALEALFFKREKADDVLLVKNGVLTDTSYANVAFFDGEKWLTPALPLLPGTCRERLLAEGKIREADIRLADILFFKKIKLFNAMTGWERGSEIPCEKIF